MLVADGTAAEFDGSLDDYRDLVLGAGGKGGNGKGSAKKVNRKDERRAAAEARERTRPCARRSSQAEAEMKRLGQRRDEIDALLAAPAPAMARPAAS